MTKKILEEEARKMIAAPMCHPDLKAAGSAWIYELGKDGERIAAENLIEEIQQCLTPIDKLVAFAHSEMAAKAFGEEGAKNFAKHADELEASGAKYCDCAACTPALKIFENKEVIFD